MNKGEELQLALFINDRGVNRMKCLLRYLYWRFINLDKNTELFKKRKLQYFKLLFVTEKMFDLS